MFSKMCGKSFNYFLLRKAPRFQGYRPDRHVVVGTMSYRPGTRMAKNKSTEIFLPQTSPPIGQS